MEWFLIIGGVIALLVWTGRKSSGKAGQTSSKTEKEPNFRPSRAMETQQAFEGRNPSRKSSAPARWVPAGEVVKIGAYRLDSGMLYIGGILPGQREGQSGNCVIDPTSNVATSGEDLAGASMHYWPSYQNAKPVARRTYLEWLAGGRQNPDIGIGYVFLFFYGIERRLFVDNARAEAPFLIQEVSRLLQLYGTNSSFRNYASRFLDAASLVASTEIVRPEISGDLQSGYEMPMGVRVYLGKKLATKMPLDAKDALLWVLSLPDTTLRTPGTRCFDELCQHAMPDSLEPWRCPLWRAATPAP